MLIVGRLLGKILEFVSEAEVGGKVWEEASCRHAERGLYKCKDASV